MPLPARDIVFQAGAAYSGYDRRVGFVNADGSGLTYVEVTDERIAPILEPAWTGDGGLLVFAHRYQSGLIAISASGELRR